MAVTDPGSRRRVPARRWVPIVAAVACVGAVVFLLVGGLRSNIVYFRTTTEAVEERDDGRIRLAGEVVPATVVETGDGVAFSVSDGETTVDVVHEGDPPELFAEEAPVVAEGSFDESFETFRSDRILIRHGNEYSPPDVDGGEG